MVDVRLIHSTNLSKKIVCAYNCDTMSVLRKHKIIVEKDAFHISTDGGCCYIVKVLKLDQEERDSYPDSDTNWIYHQGQVTFLEFISSYVKMRVVIVAQNAIIHQYPLLSSMGVKLTIFSLENIVPNKVAFSILPCK